MPVYCLKYFLNVYCSGKPNSEAMTLMLLSVFDRSFFALDIVKATMSEEGGVPRIWRMIIEK